VDFWVQCFHVGLRSQADRNETVSINLRERHFGIAMSSYSPLSGGPPRQSYGAKTAEARSSPSDKLQQVQGQVSDLKGVMVEVVEKALQRGEKLEVLEEKTDHLQQSAVIFAQKSTQLKWRERWRAWRNLLLVLVAGAIVLVLILWAAGAFQ